MKETGETRSRIRAKQLLTQPLWRTVTMSIILTTLWMADVGHARDWPQWGGTACKNMVSDEKGLPDSFVPGEKDSAAGQIKLETAKNVKWGMTGSPLIVPLPIFAAPVIAARVIDR